MIESIKVIDRKNTPLGENHIKYFKWLNRLEGREGIKLSPGINFLCGENGSGKTSMLTLIAHYFHCMGGYPKITQKSMTDVVKWNPFDNIFADDDKQVTPTQDLYRGGCEFVCDGAPVFFVSGELSTGDSENTFIHRLMRKQIDPISSGENNIANLREIVDMAKTIKDIEGLDHIESMTEDWQKVAAISLTAYHREENKDKEKRPLIILDEVEANLDPINQIFFFKAIFEQISKWAQVIFTSHSIFSFYMAREYKANIIETKRGYFNRTIKELEGNGFSFSYKKE